MGNLKKYAIRLTSTSVICTMSGNEEGFGELARMRIFLCVKDIIAVNFFLIEFFRKLYF